MTPEKPTNITATYTDATRTEAIVAFTRGEGAEKTEVYLSREGGSSDHANFAPYGWTHGEQVRVVRLRDGDRNVVQLLSVAKRPDSGDVRSKAVEIPITDSEPEVEEPKQPTHAELLAAIREVHYAVDALQERLDDAVESIERRADGSSTVSAE